LASAASSEDMGERFSCSISVGFRLQTYSRAVSLSVSKFNWPCARAPDHYYHYSRSPPPPPSTSTPVNNNPTTTVTIQVVAISIWPSVVRTSPIPVRWRANDLSGRDDCARLRAKHSAVAAGCGG